ncbi:MAG: hydroxyquinol 1,2-dioxygenase [Alphaproteobacteria bacterium]|nr:hydroxyquinol 1,2-dioxygenase [Alphaproteobacteria bacterium]
MRDITFDNITETVIQAYSGAQDARSGEILALLIRRLHDFVREANLTPLEWEAAMGILARAAASTDGERNEFILLSNLLGVSALVDLLDGQQDQKASITTLMGPFYVPETPVMENGADLTGDNGGERIVVYGQIRDSADKPLSGAQIEVWQNAPNGLYAVQDPSQPEHNLRGTLHADKNGNYAFATAKPMSYKVPEDGAGGELVRAGGRHCWRPAHIHIMVTAEGCKRHISQIFDLNDPYIDEDAVFGVRGPLAVPYDQQPGEEELARFAHIQRPFNVASVDFVLAPA